MKSAGEWAKIIRFAMNPNVAAEKIEAIRDEQRKCCWKRYMAIDRPILPEAKERAIADAILNAGKM